MSVILFAQEGLYGYKDFDGEIIVEPRFELATEVDDDGYAIVLYKGTYEKVCFFGTRNGYKVVYTPRNYVDIRKIDDKLGIYLVGTGSGIGDSKRFLYLCDNLTTVYNKYRTERLFDSRSGEWIETTEKYNSITPLEFKWASYEAINERGIVFLDKELKIVDDQRYLVVEKTDLHYRVYCSKEGVAYVAIVDYDTGKRSDWFTEIGVFVNGKAFARKDNTLVIIDGKGKILQTTDFDGYITKDIEDEYGFFVISKDGFFGIMNKEYKRMFEPQFDSICPYECNKGILKVCDDGLYGIVTIDGKWLIKIQFRSIEEFHSGIAVYLDQDGKCGYIKDDGTFLTTEKFDCTMNFSDRDFARVGRYTKRKMFKAPELMWTYISKEGKLLTDFIFKEVPEYEGPDTKVVDIKGNEGKLSDYMKN